MKDGPEKLRHIDGRINRIGTDDLIKAFGSPATDLAGLRAFDLYPHTHHMETVALLTPRG